MEITIDTDRSLGFGDQLCLLSLLCDIPDTVILKCNNKDSYYDKFAELIRILEIPETKIKLVKTVERGNFYGAWHLKTVSDYYHPRTVNVLGRKKKVTDSKRNKTFIGMACYNGLDLYLDHSNIPVRGSSFREPYRGEYIPQCRYRSIDHYSRIFSQIKKCGYDVISLDGPSSLEHKIEMLTEHCAAVIGYEGGIAHLCHMLNIPYIMLKYRPNKETYYGEFIEEVIHQSNTVEFIWDDEALFKMNKRDLDSLIARLKQGQGNNRLVNGKFKMSFKRGIDSPVSFLTADDKVYFENIGGACISESAASMINHYYKYKFPTLSL
jgi:hypothetical protein